MPENKNSVLSILKNESTTKQIKKNIILSELSRESFELSKRIMRIFSDYETKILFYSEKDNHFLEGDEIVQDIEELLTNAALVFNFVSVKRQISRDLSRKIEMLNITSLQNSLSTRMIFSAKNTIKKILEAHSFKTPTFEFVGRKTAKESFSNFIQPSRIFSAENHFFSGKIDTAEEMQNVYNKAGKDISKYFIEEYIEGKNIYSFVFKKDEKILSYNIEKKGDEFVMIEIEVNNEISEYSKKLFIDMGIGKFAMVSLKKSESRGIFVLNIFTDWDILMGNQGKTLSAIFEQESVTEKEILQSFLI